MSIPKTKHTTQYIENMSFDDDYKKKATTLLTENTEGTALTTQKAIATEAKQDEILGLQANRILIDGNYIYEGNAEIGSATSSAVWQISRFDKVNLTTEWADGNSNYDNVFDNVTSLNFS